MLINLLTVPTTACTGPSSEGAIVELLLGPASTYSKFTRPGVARAERDAQQDSLNTTVLRQADVPPETVELQMQLYSILSVEQPNSAMKIDFLLRSTWSDWRLKFDASCWSTSDSGMTWVGLPGEVLTRLWQPDTYMENSADPEIVREAVWLREDGKVWKSSKQRDVVPCVFDFTEMPYDRQACSARFGTLRDSKSEVNFTFLNSTSGGGWIRPNAALVTPAEWDICTDDGSDPSRPACITGHRVEDTKRYGSTDDESLIAFTFTITRNPEYYEQFVLAPLYMLVACSWMSFFIDPSAAPARVGLTAIATLAATNFVSAISAQLPRQAGSVWLLDMLFFSAILFCFGAIVEYTIVNYLFCLDRRLGEAWKAEAHAAVESSYWMRLSEDLKHLETHLEAHFAKYPEGSMDGMLRGKVDRHSGTTTKVKDEARVAEPEMTALRRDEPEMTVQAVRVASLHGSLHRSMLGMNEVLSQARTSVRHALANAHPPIASTTHMTRSNDPELRARRRDCRYQEAGALRFLLDGSGDMRMSAQQLDAASRILYPVAYGIFLAVMQGKRARYPVPEQF